MPLSRRLIISAAVATVAVGSGVAVALWPDSDAPYRPPSAAHVVQPGAPGQSGRSLSPSELAQISAPGFTAADTLFIEGMIPHHAQALEMTALIKDRTTNRDVALLGERIEMSQRGEIELMQRWLEDRGIPTAGPNAGHAGHKNMPGMLTEEQFDQLKKAHGAEFDRLFLTFMIGHHQGALTMVQELYATGGGLEPAADQFAREVNADQSIEIERMQAMLAKMR